MQTSRVSVYRNLKYGRKVALLYSVRNKRTRRVDGDVRSNVWLRHCKFRVNEAGRQRVLQQKRKNVHAFVDGTESQPWHESSGSIKPERVLYNPYHSGSFYVVRDGVEVPVVTADAVRLGADGMFAWSVA